MRARRGTMHARHASMHDRTHARTHVRMDTRQMIVADISESELAEWRSPLITIRSSFDPQVSLYGMPCALPYMRVRLCKHKCARSMHAYMPLQGQERIDSWWQNVAAAKVLPFWDLTFKPQK